MATMHISNWQVVDARDTSTPLTLTVFDDKEQARQWTREREADLYEAVKNDVIGGVHYKEERLPARFLVSSRAATPYLSFGARVVEEVFRHTIPVLVIGVPIQHTDYLTGRLHSGLVGFSGPWATLEEALDAARSLPI